MRLRVESVPGRSMRVAVTINDVLATSSRDRLLSEARASRSSALGQVVTAAFLDQTQARVALVAAGTLRRSLPYGTLTIADVYGVLRDDARLGVYEMDGVALHALLERTLSLQLACGRVASERRAAELAGADPSSVPWPENADDLFSVGGLVLSVDWNQPEGSRITAATLPDGTPFAFEGATSVALCNTDVCRTGTYPMLADARPYAETLWGPAADALRSLVLQEDWEIRAAALAGA